MSNDIDEVGYQHPTTGTVHFVPSANRVELVECSDDNCPHIHVFLLDKMNQPIAEATFSREFAAELIKWHNKHR